MKSRLVMDTNVLVSAQLNPNGNEAVILALALSPAGAFDWYVSDAILTEYHRVLQYKKFPISKENVERLQTLIRYRVTVVKPMMLVSESRHDPDNRFLECAEAARANYLVTGNTKHFPKQWKTTKIVNARDLLQSL